MKISPPNRLVSFIVAVALLLSAIALPVFADDVWTASDSVRIYIATDNDAVNVYDSNDETVRCANLFYKEYAQAFGKKLYTAFGASADARQGDVILKLDSSLPIPAEGYTVSVNLTAVTISASTHAGLFYGCREVIKQLKIYGKVIAMEEEPSASERTLLLDVGNSALSADTIVTLIREMSWVNMNQIILYFSEETGIGSGSPLLACFEGCDGSLFHQTDSADTALTHAEIHEIARVAALYNVEIVTSTAAVDCVSYTDPAEIYAAGDIAVAGDTLPLLIENPDAKTDAEILADKLPLLRAYGVKRWNPNMDEVLSYDTYVLAMDTLGPCPAFELPDLTALETLVAEYKTYAAKELIYTAPSFDNYENIVNNAKNCLGPNFFLFSQTQIDDMAATVESARDNLVKLPTDTLTLLMINELKGYITTYNLTKKNTYTLDSWHLYSNAVYAGKVLLEDRNYTGSDIMVATYIAREAFKGLTRERDVAAYRIDGLTSAGFRSARIRVGGTAKMTVTTPRNLNLTGVVVVDENGDIVARGVEQAYNRRQPNKRNFLVSIPTTEVGTHTYTVYGVVNDTRVYTGFLYTNDPIACTLQVVK